MRHKNISVEHTLFGAPYNSFISISSFIVVHPPAGSLVPGRGRRYKGGRSGGAPRSEEQRRRHPQTPHRSLLRHAPRRPLRRAWLPTKVFGELPDPYEVRFRSWMIVRMNFSTTISSSHPPRRSHPMMILIFGILPHWWYLSPMVNFCEENPWPARREEIKVCQRTREL